ncbi:hypothetical protein INR49_012007 [Caranx melampygus]|nr:hypothetical protein INR49_012007 [Caranx melampygus]
MKPTLAYPPPPQNSLPGAEAHVAEVVGEEGARAVGRVPREQQPAEERDVSSTLHAAVQLHRSVQHQQLQRLQQPQLLLAALKHLLTQLLPLLALSRKCPLAYQAFLGLQLLQQL